MSLQAPIVVVADQRNDALASAVRAQGTAQHAAPVIECTWPQAADIIEKSWPPAIVFDPE